MSLSTYKLADEMGLSTELSTVFMPKVLITFVNSVCSYEIFFLNLQPDKVGTPIDVL